jgi:Tfp pilus assembly protein PilO
MELLIAILLGVFIICVGIVGMWRNNKDFKELESQMQNKMKNEGKNR